MSEELTMQDEKIEEQNTKVSEDPAQEMQVISTQLQTSPEVTKVAEALDVSNAKNIMAFGQETAVEISKFSDKILATINNSQVEDSGRMMKQLSNIMDKFDPKDSYQIFLVVQKKIFRHYSRNMKQWIKKYHKFMLK